MVLIPKQSSSNGEVTYYKLLAPSTSMHYQNAKTFARGSSTTQIRKRLKKEEEPNLSSGRHSN